LVFVLRLALVWFGILGTDLHWQKAQIAFLGIRRIGMLYYMQYAFARAEFRGHAALWAVVACTALLFTFLHKMTSTSLVQMTERQKRL